MNKNQLIKMGWAFVIFVSLAVGIGHAAEVDSNSVWFLAAVLIAHTFITVKNAPKN